MAKKKYEKPELIELNEKNVVQGRCGSGSVNAKAHCVTGGSAPTGNCRSGSSADPIKHCRPGGNIS